MNCLHESSAERDWLPMENGLLGNHVFCKKCGIVKTLSSDRGKNIGYFINSLSNLRSYMERKGYRISQSQVRLILKEFEEKGFCDVYSTTFSRQKEGFIRIVRKYIKIADINIMNFV